MQPTPGLLFLLLFAEHVFYHVGTENRKEGHQCPHLIIVIVQLTGVMILTAFVSKRKNRELVSVEEESGFYTNTGLVSARVFVST